MKRYLVTDYGVIPSSPELQSDKLRAVLDLCGREGGGTVVLPRGRYRVAGLYLPSNTTLYLESGAELYGSDDCRDYPVLPIPEGVEMRSDMEMIPGYFDYYKCWPNRDIYRRAILSSYGERNIAVIGEPGAVIDGVNCYDPEGEEGYRGPHAIFFSDCENIRLEGYTVRNSGNFMHETNNCRHLVMRRVTCLGGSDGLHLHCTEDALLEDCLMKTGDDCVAGINVRDLVIRRCVLNTACNLLRIGGIGILLEDCYAYGPGYYPHRQTVVKRGGKELPRTEGRHNTLSLIEYFASTAYPFPPSDITLRRCVIEDLDTLLSYRADSGLLHSGTRLASLTLEDVTLRGLGRPSSPRGAADMPLSIRMRNVVAELADGTRVSPFLLGEDEHVEITEE